MISLVNYEASGSTAHDYCINKATPDESNLYYATVFDKDKNKKIIICHHAFLYELTDIIYECSDPGVARIKLGWWQEEIDRLFNKQARHPVTRQIQELIDFDQKLKSTFNSIIEFFNHFIFIEQTDSLDTILSLYKSTTGEIWYQCANLLQPEKIDSLESIRDMGALIHFISCLQQPKTYINETRCIIPASYINHTDLLNIRFDFSGRNEKQKECFTPLLLDLEKRLNETYKELNTKDNIKLQHVLIMNRLALKTCEEITREGCDLLGSNISLTPLRKLWIAWWTHLFLT